MSARSLAICALIAVPLAGCSATGSTSSTPSFSGVQAKVATVVNDLGSYAQSRETKQICNQLLAPQLGLSVGALGEELALAPLEAVVEVGEHAQRARRLADGSESCEKVLGDQINNVDDFTITVSKVTVTGNSAVASVVSKRNGKTVTDTINLQKIADGSWRIESLD